jgi:hypothetical protein
MAIIKEQELLIKGKRKPFYELLKNVQFFDETALFF